MISSNTTWPYKLLFRYKIWLTSYKKLSISTYNTPCYIFWICWSQLNYIYISIFQELFKHYYSINGNFD